MNLISKMMKYFIFILLLLFILSCKKDPAPVDDDHTGPYSYSETGFYIINEGNFGSANGSLSYVNPEDDAISNDIFTWKNGRLLGDIPYSMEIFNNRGYIVVNNSSRIEIINISDLSSFKTITGLNSPRYIKFINSSKAFVSQLYSDSVVVIDLVSNTIARYIDIHRSSENIIVIQNKAYIANWSNYSKPSVENDYIMVVDLNTELLTDSIHVVKEPNSMIVDKNQKLWVLCSGGYMNEETPALIRINPADKSIEQVFSFPDKYRSPFSLKTNNSGDSLYFIDNDVFAMSINDAVLPANYIIPEGTHSFYSLAINPHNSHFILTDALDYNQNGKVYRFSPSGSLLKTYTAGIIPGNVCFN